MTSPEPVTCAHEGGPATTRSSAFSCTVSPGHARVVPRHNDLDGGGG